jgi:hypothetical protein
MWRKTTTEFAQCSVHAGVSMTSDITRMDAGDDDVLASLNKSDLVRAQRQEILEKPKRGQTLDWG